MEINFETNAPLDRYRLMIQSVVPRPIAWTLTRNESGSFNLAPFSYFNAVHSHPPLVMMSIGNKRDRSPKDTRRNIEREKYFVVHIPGREHAEQVTRSSLPLPAGESEVDDCGLEVINDWTGFPLPRLKTAKIAFGCRLERVLEIGENRQGVLFGEILRMYVAPEIASATEAGLAIDAKKLSPLARLGGDDFGTLGEIIRMQRPAYRPF